MAELNETQLVFLLGFLYGAECVQSALSQETKAACERMKESRERFESEGRRELDEIKRIKAEQRREFDEIIGRMKDSTRTEVRAIDAMFTAAINAVISDPDTLLKIEDAILAELARQDGANSAAETKHEEGTQLN